MESWGLVECLHRGEYRNKQGNPKQENSAVTISVVCQGDSDWLTLQRLEQLRVWEGSHRFA
jgi:hypothetical protein